MTRQPAKWSNTIEVSRRTVRSLVRSLRLSSIVFCPPRPPRLDGALATYIEMLWEEGEPKNYASDGIAAVQFFLPSAKGHLNPSWSRCGAWNRHDLPSRALPLTPELLATVCGALLRAGLRRMSRCAVFGFAALASYKTPCLVADI